MNNFDITSMQIKLDKLEQQRADMLDTLLWIKVNCSTHSGVEVYYKCKETIERVEQ